MFVTFGWIKNSMRYLDKNKKNNFIKMPLINPKEQILEARKFEEEGFILEAYRSYGEAIDLLKCMIAATENENRKAKYNKNIVALENYYQLLEDRILPKDRLVKNTIIKISKGSTGYTYENLLGSYLNESIKEIHIYESYLIEEHQIQNLVCFLELLFKNCKNLRFLCVFTKKLMPKSNQITKENYKMRKNVFDNLLKQFKSFNIVFRYRFKIGTHDRLIMLGNGTNISLGYGLDIYERLQRFSLGSFAYELRKCKETLVHITSEYENLPRNESEEDTQYEGEKDDDGDGDDKSNLEHENLI